MRRLKTRVIVCWTCQIRCKDDPVSICNQINFVNSRKNFSKNERCFCVEGIRNKVAKTVRNTFHIQFRGNEKTKRSRSIAMLTIRERLKSALHLRHKNNADDVLSVTHKKVPKHPKGAFRARKTLKSSDVVCWATW